MPLFGPSLYLIRNQEDSRKELEKGRKAVFFCPSTCFPVIFTSNASTVGHSHLSEVASSHYIPVTPKELKSYFSKDPNFVLILV